MDNISSYFDIQLYKLIYKNTLVKKWGLQENCGKL
jgi:hypothetical protein